MKQNLKQQTYSIRKNLGKDEVMEKSSLVKKHLYALPEFQKAKNILFYASFNNEVDTGSMIKESLMQQGKKIIMPFVAKNNPILQLSELKDFNELEPKTFGILEPKELYIREFSHEKLDVAIIPGMVFDHFGHRIGYGYGYYDRFLKQLKKTATKIGLAYDFQVVDKIQEEQHDIPVDFIVTESKIIKCRKN